MANINLLDLGNSANDGTGDSLRSGGNKINNNFIELTGRTASLSAQTITNTNDIITISGDTSTVNNNFNTHTGDTTIHYTKSSINLSDLGSSGHTHTSSDITDFDSAVTGNTEFMSKSIYDPTGINEQLVGITSAQTISNKTLSNTDSISFDTTNITQPLVGQINWNDEDGTVNIGLKGGNVVLQTGQEHVLYVKADVDILNGEVVYVTGAVGASGRATIDKFIADSSIQERSVVGIATEDILTGQFGFITILGNVRGLDTTGQNGETWVDGDVLYASPANAGGLTNIEPIAPNQAIPLALVVKSHASAGTILARATELGYHLGELHDVYITGETNNDTLLWNTSTSRWENRQIDISDLSGFTDNNDYSTGGTFNTSTGDVTINSLSGNTFDINIDGRYNNINDFNTHTGDTSNPHSVTKSQVGLSNVDNTSDADKPVSTATQSALNLKTDKTLFDTHTGDTSIHYAQSAITITESQISDLGIYQVTSEKGNANGYAELDANGYVPSSQLPAFVDDVLDFDDLASFPATGSTGVIYIATDTNITYRWSGSVYVPIGSDLALGETSSTAYRGDRGKIAFDHSQIISGNPHNVTKTEVGLGNVDNTSDADKPVSTATQTELDLKANQADLVTHSGDTSIHYTKSSINLSDLGDSAHTHTISNIIDFPTNVSSFTNDVGYITGFTDTFITGATVTGTTTKSINLFQNDGNLIQATFTDESGGGSGESVTGSTFDTDNGDLTLTTNSGSTIVTNFDGRYSLTGHTHTASDITDFQSAVSGNTAVTNNTAKISYTDATLVANTVSGLTSHTGDTTIHYTKSSINLSDLGSSAHTHPFSEITDTPVTLSGYGITDAYPLSGNPSGFISDITTQTDPKYLRSDVADTKSNGTLNFLDNVRLKLGSSTSGYELYHNGTDGYISSNVGNLIIQDGGTGSTPTRFTFGRTTGDFTNTGVISSQGTSVNSMLGSLDVDRQIIVNESQFNSVGIEAWTQTNGWVLRGRSNANNYSGMLFDSTDNGVIALRNSGGTVNVNIESNGRTYFNGGNVSIGNTSNTYKLDVTGTGKFSNILRLESGDQSTTRLKLHNQGTNGGEFDIIGGIHNNSQSGFSIYDVDNAATRFLLNAGGNISIGNINDTYKLDVAGTGRFTSTVQLEGEAVFGNNFRIRPSTGAFPIYSDINNESPFITHNSGSTRALTLGISDDSNISQWLHFNELNNPSTGYISLGTQATERLRVSQNGNLLIGTTTDSGHKLDVSGTSRFTDTLTVTGGTFDFYSEDFSTDLGDFTNDIGNTNNWTRVTNDGNGDSFSANWTSNSDEFPQDSLVYNVTLEEGDVITYDVKTSGFTSGNEFGLLFSGIGGYASGTYITSNVGWTGITFTPTGNYLGAHELSLAAGKFDGDSGVTAQVWIDNFKVTRIGNGIEVTGNVLAESFECNVANELTGSTAVTKIVSLSQADYDAQSGSTTSTTLYIITG